MIDKLSFNIICSLSDFPNLNGVIDTLPQEVCVNVMVNTIEVGCLIHTIEQGSKIDELGRKLTIYKGKFPKLNFAKLRNSLHVYTTTPYIFAIDVDERLCTDYIELKHYINELDNNPTVGGLRVSNFIAEMDCNNILVKQTKIYRNNFNWKYAVHENISSDIEAQGFEILDTTILQKHLGYLTSKENTAIKINRNLEALKIDIADYGFDEHVKFNAYRTLKALYETNKA
jgi:hypothetical protein